MFELREIAKSMEKELIEKIGPQEKTIRDIALESPDKTIIITSSFQWLDWDGESMLCMDLERPFIPIDIEATEEQNDKVKGNLFDGKISYTYINDFLSHIKLLKIVKIQI